MHELLRRTHRGEALVRPQTPSDAPTYRLRSLAEVAERFGVSIKTVRRMVARGDLPTCRIGKLLRVADDDVAAYLERSQSSSKT